MTDLDADLDHYVVMTAHDQAGNLSAFSNEIVISGSETAVPGCDPLACDDGDLCNGVEQCQGDSCVPGPPLECPSPTDCSLSACDPIEGCRNLPVQNGTSCDDAMAATVLDARSGSGFDEWGARSMPSAPFPSPLLRLREGFSRGKPDRRAE